MKIFITGCTGFIGSHFIKFVINELGESDLIYILLRNPDSIKFNQKNIKLLVGDLKDIIKYKKELLECHYVFHFAANAEFKNKIKSDYDKINFLYTVQMVDILKKSKKLKNFVFISTIGAVDRNWNDDCSKPLSISSKPNPRSLYGKSKLKAESYIKSSGIRYTIIRPGWVYGRDMRKNSHINKFVTMVYQRNILTKFNFIGKVSIIHVDDLCRALVNNLHNNLIINKTYFAVTEEISIGDIFKIIENKIFNKTSYRINLIIWFKLFRLFISKLHFLLPLSINNLFVDYLVADKTEFINEFDLNKIINFDIGINDVIDTNILVNGKWIITGANSGIGLKIVEKLEKKGKQLILIDRNDDNINKIKNAVVIKSDLSDLRNIKKIATQLLNEKIFCIINNAGVGYKKGIIDINLNEIFSTINVNCFTPVLLIKFLLNNLIKNNSIIVNIASSVSYIPLPNMSLYAASKAFLASFSESIEVELKHKIKVITIMPSGTYTNFQKNAGVKVRTNGKGLLSADYVANKIIDSIQNNKNFVIIGFSGKIMLFLSRIIPFNLRSFFWGKLFEKVR